MEPKDASPQVQARPKRRFRRFAFRVSLLILAFAILIFFQTIGCVMLTPLPRKTTLDDRLRALPNAICL